MNASSVHLLLEVCECLNASKELEKAVWHNRELKRSVYWNGQNTNIMTILQRILHGLVECNVTGQSTEIQRIT